MNCKVTNENIEKFPPLLWRPTSQDRAEVLFVWSDLMCDEFAHKFFIDIVYGGYASKNAFFFSKDIREGLAYPELIAWV